MKLQAALLQTTWSQTVLDIESDLSALENWSSKFQIFASQQGGLDVQYLASRYSRGKEAVAGFMEQRHVFANVKQITLAQGEIVEKQASLGRSLLLVGRALSVDESLSLVQAVCGGNSSTLGFVLMSFDVQEVSLIYKESTHGGDKRKTNQHCLALTSGAQKHVEWSKSRMMLGSLTGIDRARVTDLQNPDDDRPLAPHFRVQQRGVEASKSILMKMLDGLQLPEGSPILVVDCLPNKFGEWSQACAQLQLDELLGNNKALAITYLGICLSDDPNMRSLSSTIAGQFMAKWIPEMIKTKYGASQSTALSKLEDQIANNRELAKALKGSLEESGGGDPSPSGSVPGESGSRTLASPDFTGAVDVPNFTTRVVLESKPIDDFYNGRTIQCEATLAGETNLRICKDSTGSLWLANDGGCAELGPKELFGFNLGAFTEVVAGDAATIADSIPWLVTSDLQVVCVVFEKDGSTQKELMTVADTMCWIARTKGATEAAMLDHDLEPLTEDGPNGQKIPKQFRYRIIPKSKVNSFKPKKLEGDTALVRYSQFGAIFDMFKNLPSTSNFGIVWEVKVSDGIPSVVTPAKPKFYFKSITTVPAKTAVLVQ
ncbi:unnamed protein product [Cladocopium goreaui]|uniref:7,8-didemethyl-8-hydroxy-5-deazariboflavin synthase n=1 Tax=Cladocopium goreaui TaxID=2562237 RepID=A0A9P1GEE4_9DINO|nr:unnamed protein product [Cladocopium goreaui]